MSYNVDTKKKFTLLPYLNSPSLSIDLITLKIYGAGMLAPWAGHVPSAQQRRLSGKGWGLVSIRQSAEHADV